MAGPGWAEGHEERPVGRTELTGPVPERPAADEGVSDAAELKVRLAVRSNRLRELAGELAEARSVAGKFQAARETLEERVRALEDERDRLAERVRELEEEVRRHRQRREVLERAAGERDAESAGLHDTINELRERLEEEYELRRSLAEPENRLRAGIELFNESAHRDSVGSLSRSMGQPEVHVALEEGEEPAAVLNFTWQGITWQTYAANPGLGVEEPRVYLLSSGEDLSGVDREPPNAHIGPGGRLYLGSRPG